MVDEPEPRMDPDDDAESKAPDPPRREDEDDAFPGVNEILGTFMNEASLWPVLIVVLGSGGAFGAAMLILVGVDRNPFAAAALLLVLGMSIDVGLRARKELPFRNIAKFVALLWSVAFAFAALAVWSGIASV